MTDFVSWQHRIADGLARRTLPARLSDMKNVKDFGALGNESHDDTTNIQTAIDAAATSGGGTVFFPPGAYKVTAPLKNDNVGTSVRFVGFEKYSTRLEGTTMGSGYVIDTSGADGKIGEINGLTVYGYGDGAIRMTGTDGASLRDLVVAGPAAIDMSGSNRVSCYTIANGTGANNVGYYTGDNTSLFNCNGMGLAVAVQACGTGLLMMGCRTETNTVSLALGKDRAGSVSPLTNFAIYSHTTERNRTAVELYSAHLGIIGGCLFQGTHGITQLPVSLASWAAGKVTITSDGAHGLSVGQGVRIDSVKAGYDGFFIVTDTPSGTTFKYAVVADPGSATPTGSSSWTELQYNGINIPTGGRVSNVSIMGIQVNSAVYIACMNLENMNVADSLSIYDSHVDPVQAGNTLGTTRIFPSVIPPGLRLLGGDFSRPPIAFANLPSSPVEGMEFSVSDANLSGKAWGDVVSVGSSSGHALLHRNASAWTLEGI